MRYVAIAIGLIAMSIVAALLIYYFTFDTAHAHKNSSKQKFIEISKNPIAAPKFNSGNIIAEAPADQMLQILRKSYRLQPDKRFLMSVAQIHSFLTDEPIEVVSVDFKNDAWLIQYKNLEVGTFPEAPDFSDAMRMLSAWTQKLQTKHHYKLNTAEPEQSKELNADADRFYLPYQIMLLRKINTLWLDDDRDSGFLPIATRALVNLNLQNLDQVELGDFSTAKALTMLVLSKNLTQEKLVHEECLLSHTMGYTTHAFNICKSLPEKDPVRFYGTNQNKELEDAANLASASDQTHYLWLLRLASLKNEDDFSKYRRAVYPKMEQPLSIIRATLGLDDFSMNRTWSRTALPLIVEQITQDSLLPGTSPQIANDIISKLQRAKSTPALIDSFEKAISDETEKKNRPFLTSTEYSSYYRNYFYSALYIQGLFYMDELSSVEAVTEFSDDLKKASANPYITDFQKWYGHLAESKQGAQDLQPLFNDFQNLSIFGARILFRTMERITPRADQNDPKVYSAIKTLVSRMDTRVRHRYFLADLMRDELRDLKQQENLCSSIFRDDVLDESEAATWCAQYTGNTNVLMGLLNSRQFKVSKKGKILRYLRFRDDVDAGILEDQFKKAIKENPEDWDIREEYVEFLRQKERNAETISVINEWLRTHDDSDGFDYLFAIRELGEGYYRDGKYEEGWEVVEPEVSSYQAGVLIQGFFLLYKLGREQESLKLAHETLERYPDDTNVLLDMDEVLWRLGKYTEAAQEIHSFSYPITTSEWCYDVGKKFATVFKDQSKEQVIEAIGAMIDIQAPGIFFRCASENLGDAGKYDLAYEVSMKANEHGLADMGMFVSTYKYLRESKGKEEALVWARSVQIQQKYSDLSLVMFDYNEHELMWELIQDPEQTPEPNVVWLMRAASSVRPGSGLNYNRDQLLQHYQTTVEDFYHKLGRYLLGLSDEQDILKDAENDLKKRSLAAFMFGLKAQSNGNYSDAVDWYRISNEIVSDTWPVYPSKWVSGIFNKWKKERKNLAQLAAKGL